MEPFKILVAEDDRNIRAGLVDALELEGYVLEEAADGSDALRKFTVFRPDLVLLDVMMPNLNGYEVCRRIRRGDAATPIIMLTAKGEEIDKVLGLELGADDYVTKPFGLRELTARIAAQLRRRRLESAAPPPAAEFAFGPWRVDVKKLAAGAGDASVELTVREVELLRLFAAHPGEVLDRNFIMREIWGSALTSSRTLDQHLVALRRKLEPEHFPRLIETVYGVGYHFRGE